MSVTTIKFIDRNIGFLFCAILGFFSRKKKLENVKRILLIQLWGIGETILLLPSIKVLRKKFPFSEIDVLATERNYEVFYENKYINKAIKVNLNLVSLIFFILKNYKKYDIVFDMEEYLNISAILAFFSGKFRIGYSHNTRSLVYNKKVKFNDKQHLAYTFLDLMKTIDIKENFSRLEHLNYSEADKIKIDNFLEKNSLKKSFLIGIASGASESAKSRIWPYYNYAELCNEMLHKRKNCKIVFIGNKNERELINEIINKIELKDNVIDSSGLFSLNELFCFIEKCDLFIGNDSGPMHIASAQGVKTIGLFGPNIPLRFAPFGRKNISLYKGYNCQFSPCINVHKGQVPDCLFKKNSDDYQKCMKNISVEDVFQAISRFVK